MKNKKLKKLGNLKLRTKKLGVFMVIMLVLTVGVSGVLADITFKYGTDGSGDSWEGAIGVIRNSNGRVWEATGANIQNAIDDLSTTGGKVELPPVTFYIVAPIIPVNNTCVAGSGIGGTIIKVGTGYTDANDFGMFKAFESLKLHNFTLSDMTIDGNFSMGGDARGCINLWGATDCIFENLWLTGPNRGGLGLSHNSSRIIANNIFVTNVTGAYQPISINTADSLTFTNIQVFNCPHVDTYGIDWAYVTNSTLNGVVVTNSGRGIKFADCSNLTVSTLITNGGGWLNVDGTTHSQFSNLKINCSNGPGLYMADDSTFININNIECYGSDEAGFQIDGNHININNGNVYGSNGRALSISSNAHNVSISNVIFDTFYSYNYLNGCEDIKLTSCGFINGQDSDSYGLDIKACSRIKVLGCDVSYNADYGIMLFNTANNNVTISYCSIFNNGDDGIWIDNNAHTNCSIKDNTLLGNTNEQIDDDGTGSNVIIKDNQNYDYSNYECLPVCAASPYSIAFPGATWANETTEELGICFDGTNYVWFNSTRDTDTHLTEEQVEDYVGGMLGGTETHISVDYQDGSDDIDFIVSDDWWDAVGDITDDTITEAKLEIDNVPVDEYVLTWEVDSSEMHWQAETGGGGGHNFTYIINSNNNTWEVDGSADNVQIQAAIDDCGAYGWVQLPEGTLDLDAYINMDDDIWLKGSGREATILKADADLSGTGIIGCSNEHNFTISDLTVHGDVSGNGDGNGVQCIGCNDFVIERVNSHNVGGSSFRVEDCRRGHVTNCFAYDVQGSGQHGFAILDAVECIFSDLTAWNVSNDGCGLDISQSEYCEISNLNINDCDHGIKCTGISADYSENNLFSNVHIVGTDTTAAVAALYTSYCRNVSFANFNIDGGDIGVNLFGTSNIQLINFDVKNVDHAIQIYSDDVTITNFVFEGDTGNGKAVDCLTQENIYLSNCHFNEPYGTPHFDTVDNLTIIGCTFMDGEDGGLRIEDCNDVTITACKSNGNDDDGLDIIGVCTNFTITASQFKNNGADGTGYGIDIIAGAHDNYIILGNNLYGNTDDNNDDGTGTKDVAHNIGTWV